MVIYILIYNGRFISINRQRLYKTIDISSFLNALEGEEEEKEKD